MHHVPNITVGKLEDSSKPVNQDNPKASEPTVASGDAEHRDTIQKESISPKESETGHVSKKKHSKKKN